ncbi:MAG: hypothetical protein CVV22_00490 [Ignavibacteriae bacterium HGW-Ignavibacteriae-1]|jgi:phosphate transport system substrate-binding protein|nr:MAG: hypothetical protein CVV22_00490 [Ignavibacteriae bacterium HGW-Ignavibacteriae-1]
MILKIVTLLVCILIIIGCSSTTNEPTRIIIKGSDTMYMLSIRLAAEYMKNNRNVSIYVYSGGTASGFQAIQDKSADICMASRNVEPEEVQRLVDEYSAVGVSHLIAKDALSIYVNNKNPVQSLSMQQLQNIFKCEITNWKSLGWADLKISPINRQENSGTREYFLTHVLDGHQYCENIPSALSLSNMIETISQDSAAIGYGGITYVEGVKHLNINGIEPTTENVLNDLYPIVRYLQFYTINTPKGAVKDFLDWCLSKQAQDLIKEMGFIPIWDK